MTITGYVPFADEPDIVAVSAFSTRRKVTVLLPAIENNALVFRSVKICPKKPRKIDHESDGTAIIDACY